MIYVVAINIERFAHLCRAVNLQGDGKHPKTGEIGMRYVHRPDMLQGLNYNTDKIYLSEGWTQRADYPSLVHFLKAFHHSGGKVEGADIGHVIPYKRYNRHAGTGSRRDNGLRIVSGGNYP